MAEVVDYEPEVGSEMDLFLKSPKENGKKMVIDFETPVSATAGTEFLGTGNPNPLKDEIFPFDVSGGERLVAGSYTALLQNVESKVAKSGSEGFNFTFEVDEGPCTGGRVSLWVSQLPTSRWYLRQILEELGIDVSAGKGAFAKSDVVGNRVRILVDEETRNGKTFLKVVSVSSI